MMLLCVCFCANLPGSHVNVRYYVRVCVAACDAAVFLLCMTAGLRL